VERVWFGRLTNRGGTGGKIERYLEGFFFIYKKFDRLFETDYLVSTFPFLKRLLLTILFIKTLL